MVPGDIVEVNKTLTPLLPIIHQYMVETLHSSITLSDTFTVSSTSNKPIVSDDLKGKNNDPSVTPVGECIF